MRRRVFQYLFNYTEYSTQRSGQLAGEILNLGDKWSLPPFRRAQNMDQECIIIEFYSVYGVFLLNKNGYNKVEIWQ